MAVNVVIIVLEAPWLNCLCVTCSMFRSFCFHLFIRSTWRGRGCTPCILTLRNIVARGFLFESPPFVVIFVRGLTLYYNIYCCLRHCSMTLGWLLGWSNVIFYVEMANTIFPTKWNAPPLLHYDSLLQCDHVLALPFFIQNPFSPNKYIDTCN